MKTINLIWIFLVIGVLSAQENIIPNASFEQISSPPNGWYYSGKDFSNTSIFWSSATKSSPDIYGPNIPIPKSWKEKGFGKITPIDGEFMAGLTVYGCDHGKPHCKEYIQIGLAEPLVKDQTYTLSFWVAHLPSSLQINHFGVLFSFDEIIEGHTQTLNLNPQFDYDEVLSPFNEDWMQLNWTFKAKEPFEYICFGSFVADDQIMTAKKRSSEYDFAYYYLDHIQLVKDEPILPVPKPEFPEAEQMVSGSVFQLDNIYFDHDQSTLHPRSFAQLEILFKMFQILPDLNVEIIGHTDNTGGDNYNKDLSIRRAQQVYDYLVNKGVSQDQIQIKGMGNTQPIMSNADEQGRKKNRRVEFFILENQ